MKHLIVFLLLVGCVTAVKNLPNKPATQDKCINSYTKQDFVSAKTDCALCLEISPNDADCLNGLGLVHFTAKDLNKAELLFSKAATSDPDNAMSYNNLGAVYYLKKDHISALTYFLAALDLEPNYPDARFGAILSYMDRAFESQLNWEKLEMFEKAQDQMSALLLITPDYPNASSIKGQIKHYINVLNSTK